MYGFADCTLNKRTRLRLEQELKIYSIHKWCTWTQGTKIGLKTFSTSAPREDAFVLNITNHPFLPFTSFRNSESPFFFSFSLPYIIHCIDPFSLLTTCCGPVSHSWTVFTAFSFNSSSVSFLCCCLSFPSYRLPFLQVPYCLYY